MEEEDKGHDFTTISRWIILGLGLLVPLPVLFIDFGSRTAARTAYVASVMGNIIMRSLRVSNLLDIRGCPARFC